MSTIEVILGCLYKMGKQISAGAFGEIYMGINVETKQEVAIKIVIKLYCYIIYLFFYFYIGNSRFETKSIIRRS